MRLFIAINLSNNLKDTLINVQNQMYDNGVRGNFTPEDNMHLTLAFIGEFPSAEPILDALANISFTPFEITLDGIGRYGDLWWAGIKESAPLAAVARRIRRALADNNIPFDKKRFSPHITLIRKASRESSGIQLSPTSMTVNTISLMRSDRAKAGMIYTEVGTVDAIEPGSD